jgi:hypothetical protein
LTDDSHPIASFNDARSDDKENPRHVLNLVPEAVRNAMERIPAEFLAMDEDELEARAPRQKWTLVDRRLRTAFWIEYARAQDTGSNMQISNVFNGTCSRNYFYGTIMENKIKLAYLMRPPADYTIAMEESLNFGVARLREILDFPLWAKDKDGIERPDVKVAEVILKTVTLIDQRVKGAVIQRIEQKNLNVNMGAKGTQEAEAISVDEIDRKLAELSQAIKPAITVDSEIIVTEENDDGTHSGGGSPNLPRL